jgi:ComF family protein
LTDLLFPPRCLICERDVEGPFQRPLYCDSCLAAATTPLAACCFRCGIQLPYRIQGDRHIPLVTRAQSWSGCPDCRRRKWAFDRTVAVGSYEGRWREHVYQLKRPYRSAEAWQAGKLLGERLEQSEWWSDYDYLLPLPIHWRRRFSRGFNQAERIAQGVASTLPLPLAHRVLVAARYARKQGTLSAAARKANVQQSMKLGPGAAAIRGRRVILVDDVLTTGSTADAAARLCRQAGAKRVAVAVVARAGRV